MGGLAKTTDRLAGNLAGIAGREARGSPRINWMIWKTR
jgi:hypothetical protein